MARINERRTIDAARLIERTEREDAHSRTQINRMARKKKSTESPGIANASAAPQDAPPDVAVDDSVAVSALGVTGVVFVLFVTGVYAYAAFGGSFVTHLSSELGDVIAARGVTAQKAGQNDDAIRAFQLALQKGFADPRQRLWTQERLTDTLLSAERYSEAADSAKAALEIDGRDLKLHYQLTSALWQAKQLEQALTAAMAWLEAAKSGSATEQLDPLWYQGMIYTDLGQKDKALDAFLQGAHLNPADRCSYHAAVILHERNRDKEALEMLQAYIPKATGSRAEAAQKLRDALAASGAPR